MSNGAAQVEREIESPSGEGISAFLSIPELAARWRCSRGTVYNRLRREGALVVDFAAPGRRGHKLIPGSTVRKIEAKRTKVLR